MTSGSNYKHGLKTAVSEFLIVLIVLLFIYTGLSKLIDVSGFKNDMFNQPFPRWISAALVWIIPSAEIVISILLVTPAFYKTSKYRKIGLILSLVLMLLFTFYSTAILMRLFPIVPCSCGGVIKDLSWEQHLAFNVVYDFIILAALLLHKNDNRGKKVKLNEQTTEKYFLSKG